eukprot:TRINITY_DN12787_c0_g1_i1.p1 TRINITY_DN12787_c0_g1~~TRINITY_DN12787_c0_g1_i1.p1  ORF type:complete len:157 (+),score=34.49 TRINITY_DN12787_c0_g1_i1:126-596(+)
MKVLFLDIDGVLVIDWRAVFKPALMRNLADVVSATGATIVLSSDWRRSLLARWHSYIALRLYGLSYEEWTPCLPHLPLQRSFEITEWTRGHEARQGEAISHWVAVDDRDLLRERGGEKLRGHFVRTDPNVGLDEACVAACIAILGRLEPNVGESER